MGIQLTGLAQAKHKLQRTLSGRIGNVTATPNVPKGHVAVYVGEGSRKRFVIPISYLNHPLFQDLLNRARKNMDLTIQWEVLQFHVVKSTSSV
ncbi:hypothetical protein GQ457_04G000190 [Hibiscus cannabinus]